MATILIRHTVPIPGDNEGAPLLFYQWLPEGPDRAIVLRSQPHEIRVWLDRSCVRSFDAVTDDLISKWVNITVEKLFVDVTAQEIPDDLSAFVHEKRDWLRGDSILDSDDPEVQRLAKAYTVVGWSVLKAVLEVINRIAMWAYAERGHYWLSRWDEEANVMMSRNNQFRAKASIDGAPWVRWCPPSIDVLRVTGSGPHQVIRADDWPVLEAFLLSSRRPRLSRELLSNAFALLAAGNNRSSLIEAVSALEVAFRSLSRTPDPDSLRDSAADRIQDLGRDAERLGFSAAFRYLLPVVIRDFDQHKTEHAAVCKALDTRHNIVHNGQRELSGEVAARHVRAVGVLVGLLDGWTKFDVV